MNELELLKATLVDVAQIETNDFVDDYFTMEDYNGVITVLNMSINEAYYDGFTVEAERLLSKLQEVISQAIIFNRNYGL
jgi:hypothetical protein